MILHYIYVPKYTIFQNAELHFTDHYTISFDQDTRQLRCVPNSAPLPEDFFSYSKNGKSRVVDSVSALIGNNGSGKTSIAHLVSAILTDESTEHLIVWSSNEKGRQRLFCHHMLIPYQLSDQDALYNFQKHLLTDKRNKAILCQECYIRKQDGSFQLNRSSQYYDMLCRQSSRLNQKPPIDIPANITDLSNAQFHQHQYSFVYCTNNYAVSNSISDYRNVFDLSTGYLMREDASKYLNARLGSRPNYSQANYHDRMEFLRMVELFSHLKNNPNGALPTDWSLPEPVGVTISLNLADAKQIQNHLLELNKSKLGAESIQCLLDLLSEWSSNPSQRSFADLQLFAFLGNWLRYHANGLQTHQELNDRLTNAILAACSDLQAKPTCNSASAPYVLFHHLYQATRKQSFRDTSNEKVLYGPDLSFSAAKELYNLLQNNAPQDKGTTLHFVFSDQSNFGLFVQLTRHYFESATITPYIDFQWHPRLSAGELAQYSIFSRLFHIVNSKSKTLHSNILLFLDEIEITIHPKLQRRLVENVLVFFESMFLHHKIHVIFASHSPILLSDIPSCNVCYLTKTGSTTRVLNQAADKLPESFGANIHTLYRHSFFLDGLIGSFAQHIIEELDKTIQSISDSADKTSIAHLEKRISLIGEPFLRQQLLYSLAAKCPKSLARFKLKAELDAINTRQKELVDALEHNNDQN